MKVIIPLQLASTRVKQKNIKPFFENKSLFDIKASQLLKVMPPDMVYVSSESEDVRPLVESYGFNFLLRDKALTGNLVKQPALIGSILAQIPKDDHDIMWVQVTQPLFDRFDEMMTKWQDAKDSYDSIAAVKTVRKHLVTADGLPVNFNFGYWHRVSQDLPELYELLWSCYILKRETIELTCYHLGTNPYFMPFDDVPLIDIDTEDDFILASRIYALYNNK